MSKFKVFGRYDPMQDGYLVHIRYGERGHVEPFVITNIDQPNIRPSETIAAGPDGLDFLRAVLNCAWELGLRPDGFEDSRESMKATSAHLSDMRTIAFHKLGINAA
jgi:hypothetical protein